jgi:hypothetical protein
MDLSSDPHAISKTTGRRTASFVNKALGAAEWVMGRIGKEKDASSGNAFF